MRTDRRNVVLIVGLLCMGMFLISSSVLAQSYTIRLGHVLQADHPLNLAAEKFAEIVEKETNGDIDVQVFPASQAGEEIDLLEGTKLGTLHMPLVAAGSMGRLIPAISIMDAPYIWQGDTRQERIANIKKVMEGPIGERINREFQEKHNIRILDYTWYYGHRHATANKPCKTPEDFKNLKLRTPPAPINLASGRVLGANPTPMDFKELYMALKQGVVDAQENPLPTIWFMKFYEVQDYVILTGHLLQSEILSISNEFYESLPKEYQEIIRKAAIEAGKYNTELTLKAEDDCIERIKATGTQIIEPDLAPFKARAQEVYKEFVDKWGENLLKQIQESQ